MQALGAEITVKYLEVSWEDAQLGVSRDQKLSVEEWAQGTKGRSLQQGYDKGRSGIRRRESWQRAVKVIKRFIDVKSNGQLSERAIPENGCQGPTKLKEAAHLDTVYAVTIQQITHSSAVILPPFLKKPALRLYLSSLLLFNLS